MESIVIIIYGFQMVSQLYTSANLIAHSLINSEFPRIHVSAELRLQGDFSYAHTLCWGHSFEQN